MEANYGGAHGNCYREALRLFEAIPSQLGQAIKALGDLEFMEANYPRAWKRYSAALRLYEAIPSQLGQANTLKALGDLERLEDNFRRTGTLQRRAQGASRPTRAGAGALRWAIWNA
jgi:tetratricopeptide (TPR) repeat protein